MRLKEIKPGMVIHCKTKEELEHAIEYLKIDVDANYIWNYKSSFDGDSERRDCFSFDEAGNYNGFCSREYFESEGYTITEFSDLIMPELTAEEAVEWLSKNYNNGQFYDAFGDDCTMDCLLDDGRTPEDIVNGIIKYKQDHDKSVKKEPEIETVDICRIIEILPDGRKRCVHEVDIKEHDEDVCFVPVEEILKEYCMQNDGEFIAVCETVSRVKR